MADKRRAVLRQQPPSEAAPPAIPGLGPRLVARISKLDGPGYVVADALAAYYKGRQFWVSVVTETADAAVLACVALGAWRVGPVVGIEDEYSIPTAGMERENR